MKRSRLHAPIAFLLVASSFFPALPACSGNDEHPPITNDGGNTPKPDNGKADASPDTKPGERADASPDAEPAPSPADAGPDADAEAPKPTQPVKGLVSIAIVQTYAKAAVGTIVDLTIRGTFGDGKTVDLRDYGQLAISVSADLIATPSRDFGGLSLLAKKPGKTKITVTEAQSGLSAESELEVTQAKIASLDLALARTGKTPKGLFQTAHAIATFDDKSTQDVTKLAAWSSTPEGALEAVDGKLGVYRTLKEGVATISASFQGAEAHAGFEISAAEVDAVAFVKPAEKASLRTVFALAAEATLTDGTKLDVTEGSAWTSSNAAVLLVDAKGLVTAAGLGTASITVTTANGKSATTAIVVEAPSLEAIRVVAADATGAPIDTITAGRTRRLALKGEYSDQSLADLTNDAKWESKDPSLLSVDNGAVKGLLTAKKAGETTILVSYGDKAPLELAIKVAASN